MLGKMSQAARDNRANQMNPHHSAYTQSRASTTASTDNRSDQLNPETSVYYQSRGLTPPKSQKEDE